MQEWVKIVLILLSGLGVIVIALGCIIPPLYWLEKRIPNK